MKKSAWTIVACFFGLLFFISCKKAKNNNIYSDRIVLATPVASGNTIKLSWSKLTNDSLQGYEIVRVYDTAPNQIWYTTWLNDSITTYEDSMPATPYMQYYINGKLSSSSGIVSNTVTYFRTDINFMNINPKDVLFDRGGGMLYLYNSEGNIIAYDLQNNKVAATTSSSSYIGYCGIGTYNGQKEFYVPRIDGWLYIYNAATLQQTDKIYVGSGLASVVYNNGILYIVGPTTNSIGNGIIAYNRALKTLVSNSATNYSLLQIKLVSNSNSNLWGIDQGRSYYFQFGSNGQFISAPDLYYFTGYSLDPTIFEVFPDGSKFISTNAGLIFSDSLLYVNSLPDSSIQFTSFDFDSSDQLIYAGCNPQAIKAYSMNNYKLSKTITTKGLPIKVFYNNGSIISVSSSFNNTGAYPYESTSQYCFVEQY